jgi:cyclin-dependent kinase 12/13
MTKHHQLKVADFGLARSVRGDQLFTNKVVTLWYRAPELLLGATSYDASIDMWSVGCVFAELYIGHPIFQGKTELEQIAKIFDICGTPTTETWPDYKFLPLSSKFVPEKSKPRRLKEYLMRETNARKRILPKGALDLIEALLVLDPEQRLTAADCQKAMYFQARPMAPADPASLPPLANLPHSHEYQTKKIRREQAKLMNGGGAANKEKEANAANSNKGGGGSPSAVGNGSAKAGNKNPSSALKPDAARGEGEPSAKKRRREA